MSTIHVTLVVDPTLLPSDPNTSPEAACLLYDSNLDPDDTGATNFQINAKEGDTVIFHISASDNVTVMSLIAIEAKPGQSNLFSTTPSSPSWKGTVGAVDGTEAFNVQFSVGGTTYTLDPEIRVRPA
ncbi:hypothetical protein N6H18_07560 [Reichenbachiella agarivorans]|uniref:Uncharacterized protein n=1 Tax=Reichenbachiella agarivorans TaxID=2979464 RepID=A0ABY6CWH4_9BACT|nr:hypothetical protein [Reichenbachiella agarivorans]UXP33803.1 hypothetical protein N6H18_07560 [Reichenbachiella agarivorans]